MLLTPETIKKMNQLKESLDTNPEFVESLKNTANEPKHSLITFAQQNGIELTTEDIQTYFEGMHSQNQELDDALLEMIAGGRSFKKPSYLS